MVENIALWLDAHEGAGVWLGAFVTLLAVGVALSASFQEARQRWNERAAVNKRAAYSIGHAVEILRQMRDEKFQRTVGNSLQTVPITSVTAILESANIAVRHALTLSFSDRELLRIALNLTSMLTLLSQEMARRQSPAGKAHIAAELLATELEHYSESLDQSWSTIKKF